VRARLSSALALAGGLGALILAGAGCGRRALVAATPSGDLAQTIAAGPGEIVVQATGVASGTDTAAGDQALRQALRRAVEQALGTHIEAELAVEHRRVVRERIVGRSEGFVKTYRVLSQTVQEGATVVNIEAVVKLGAIKDEVAAIRRVLEEKRMPRMLVLVGPREGGNPDQAAQTVQSAVESAFQARGFRMVQVTGAAADAVYGAYVKNEAEAVAAVAKAQGAEVVLAGSARLVFDGEREVYGAQVKFYKPEVALRAIEADTGRILFADQKTGIASARSDALAKTATELAERCIEAVVKGWSHEARNAEMVLVRVSGIAFEDFARLKRMVEGVRNVQIVRARPFSGDRGELEVEYVGDPVELAEALTKLQHLPLRVVSTSAQTVELEAKK